MKKSLQITATCKGVKTDFDYKEMALFALLVGNRLAYARIAGHYEEVNMLENAHDHIIGFLDAIDANTRDEEGART